MASDYWGSGYWGSGYWGSNYWGVGGTAAPAAAATGNRWVGQAILKRRLDRDQLRAILAYFEAEAL